MAEEVKTTLAESIKPLSIDSLSGACEELKESYPVNILKELVFQCDEDVNLIIDQLEKKDTPYIGMASLYGFPVLVRKWIDLNTIRFVYQDGHYQEFKIK